MRCNDKRLDIYTTLSTVSTVTDYTRIIIPIAVYIVLHMEMSRNQVCPVQLVFAKYLYWSDKIILYLSRQKQNSMIHE